MMPILLDDVIKLLLAIFLGGLIGAEREFRDKAAGFRTMIFICVGATLFTILSRTLGGADDPVRIAANIVSGIGFLGAGAILREGNRVTGLTTAATIWLTAALGMGIGGGHYLLAGAGSGAILFVLWLFPMVERWIDRAREAHTYTVVCPISQQKFEQMEAMIRQCGLQIRNHKQMKSGNDMTCVWDTYGSPKCHHQIMEALFSDNEVKAFRF